MNTTEQLTIFVEGLRVGSSVELRWTNSNRDYRANGVIVKMNEKTCRVRTTHVVPTEGQGYPADMVLSAALPFTKAHTSGNGVWPMTKSDDEQIANAQKLADLHRKIRERISESISVTMELPVGAGKTKTS